MKISRNGNTSAWVMVTTGCMLMVTAHMPTQGALTGYLSTFGLQHLSNNYTFMQPGKQTLSGVCTYIPSKEPLSPDKDDEYVPQKEQREKLSLDAKTVVACALSSKGTFAAVVRGSGSNSGIVLRDATSIVKRHPICSGARTLTTSFYNENIIILGSNGWILHWDPFHNRSTRFDLPCCCPSAMATRSGDKPYTVISVTSPIYGQLFYFFKPTIERDDPKGSKIMPWPVTGRRTDSISDGVTALATHPTTNSFAVARKHNHVELWNIVKNAKSEEWTFPGSLMSPAHQNITALIYHDTCIAGASSRTNLLWWDTRSRDITHHHSDSHSDYISSFQYLKDTLYTSASIDGTIKLWDIRKLGSISRMRHGAPVAAIARIDKSETLASCSKNAVVKYWSFQGKAVRP
jgi:WD40 repeat protein